MTSSTSGMGAGRRSSGAVVMASARMRKEGCPVTHRCFSMKAVIRAS